MTFEEAKELLNGCVRWSLRDHAFGDEEFGWHRSAAGGFEVASGYSGGGQCAVHINGGPSFEGEQARELKKCGTEGTVDRNDETGPDTYVEGAIMPGLTLEGVYREITAELAD